jgi:hypothetical protein
MRHYKISYLNKVLSNVPITVLIFCCTATFSISQNNTVLEKFQSKADNFVLNNYNEGNLEIEFDRKNSGVSIVATQVSTNDSVEQRVRNLHEYHYTYSCSIENSKMYSFTINYNEDGDLLDSDWTNRLLNSLMFANNNNEFDNFQAAKEVLVKLGLKRKKFSLTITFQKDELSWLILPKIIDMKNFGYQMKLNNINDVELIQPNQLLITHGP